MKRKTRKSRRLYTKKATAGITPDMWIMLQELKVETKKSKAAIIREALTEYYNKYR